jgi:hypothetical protein
MKAATVVGRVVGRIEPTNLHKDVGRPPPQACSAVLLPVVPVVHTSESPPARPYQLLLPP